MCVFGVHCFKNAASEKHFKLSDSLVFTAVFASLCLFVDCWKQLPDSSQPSGAPHCRSPFHFMFSACMCSSFSQQRKRAVILTKLYENTEQSLSLMSSVNKGLINPIHSSSLFIADSPGSSGRSVSWAYRGPVLLFSYLITLLQTPYIEIHQMSFHSDCFHHTADLDWKEIKYKAR